MQDQQDFIKNVTSWEDPVLFHGHIAFLKFKERKPFYINMIRNPLDRLISYYYFVRTGDTLRGQTERQLGRPGKIVQHNMNPVFNPDFNEFNNLFRQGCVL